MGAVHRGAEMIKKGLIVLIEGDLLYLCTHETVGDIWKHLS